MQATHLNRILSYESTNSHHLSLRDCFYTESWIRTNACQFRCAETVIVGSTIVALLVSSTVFSHFTTSAFETMLVANKGLSPHILRSYSHVHYYLPPSPTWAPLLFRPIRKVGRGRVELPTQGFSVP